ncbi:MAG: lipoprotein [Burkholderiaceae bacterium]|nr:lipoprotein [Burkholderiaceae bacterium]
MTVVINDRDLARIVAMLGLVMCLAACGFKGPLYLVPKGPSGPVRMPVMSTFGLQIDEGPIPPFFEDDPTLIPAPIVIE